LHEHVLLHAIGFAEFSEAFRGGVGYGWDSRTEEYLHGSDLTRTALPAELIDVVLDQLSTGLGTGGAVADIGCGYGSPTMAVAAHFPAARVLGIDYHDVSVTHPRKARSRGRVERTRAIRGGRGD
jgi:trans-aconitate methyltransferase